MVVARSWCFFVVTHYFLTLFFFWHHSWYSVRLEKSQRKDDARLKGSQTTTSAVVADRPSFVKRKWRNDETTTTERYIQQLTGIGRNIIVTLDDEHFVNRRRNWNSAAIMSESKPLSSKYTGNRFISLSTGIILNVFARLITASLASDVALSLSDLAPSYVKHRFNFPSHSHSTRFSYNNLAFPLPRTSTLRHSTIYRSFSHGTSSLALSSQPYGSGASWLCPRFHGRPFWSWLIPRLSLGEDRGYFAATNHVFSHDQDSQGLVLPLAPSFLTMVLAFQVMSSRTSLTPSALNTLSLSPGHPATNGAVEMVVQSVKKSLTKILSTGRNLSSSLQDWLLAYRSTPHSSTACAPPSCFWKESFVIVSAFFLQPLVERLRTSSSNVLIWRWANPFASSLSHDTHLLGS